MPFALLLIKVEFFGLNILFKLQKEECIFISIKSVVIVYIPTMQTQQKWEETILTFHLHYCCYPVLYLGIALYENDHVKLSESILITIGTDDSEVNCYLGYSTRV